MKLEPTPFQKRFEMWLRFIDSQAMSPWQIALGSVRFLSKTRQLLANAFHFATPLSSRNFCHSEFIRNVYSFFVRIPVAFPTSFYATARNTAWIIPTNLVSALSVLYFLPIFMKRSFPNPTDLSIEQRKDENGNTLFSTPLPLIQPQVPWDDWMRGCD